MHLMMSVGRTGVLLIAIFLLQACGSETSSPGADLVFTNGAVYTVNDQQPWASAVAVSDGRIVYVGDDAGVESHIGTQTRVISLAGKMLMPGFIDSHMHPMAAGTRFLRCDLEGLDWPHEIKAEIKQCATTVKPGKWFRGVNLDAALFDSGVLNKELLDGWVNEVPALITNYSSSHAWVNSATLEILGIDRSTPDPDKGVIERDPVTGESTGVLRGEAVNIPYALVPLPDTDDLRTSLQMASSMANQFGITSSNEASMRPDLHTAFLEADEAGEMSLRVSASQFWDPEQGSGQIEGILARQREAKTGRYRADSVKLFLDGSNNRTGAVLEPFEGTVDDYGTLVYQDATLNAIVSLLDANDIQIHMHAYGDAAVRQGLNALEHAQNSNPDWDRRHFLAHVALIDPADLGRFKELGVSANISGLWACLDDKRQAEVDSLDEQRAGRLLGFKDLFSGGAHVTAGSDWVSDSMNPLYSIQVAMTRRCPGKEGPAWNPEQRVGLEQMLEAYTTNGAWLFKLENKTGSIEVGKAADLIVLEQNLFETDPMKIKDVKVLLTLLEGEAVYRDGGFW